MPAAKKRSGPPPGWAENRQRKTMQREFTRFRAKMLPKIERLTPRAIYQNVLSQFALAEDLLANDRLIEAEASYVKARGIALGLSDAEIERHRTMRSAAPKGE
jgi:hypothetical protein